jgi:hypothetical protein
LREYSYRLDILYQWRQVIWPPPRLLHCHHLHRRRYRLPPALKKA